MNASVRRINALRLIDAHKNAEVVRRFTPDPNAKPKPATKWTRLDYLRQELGKMQRKLHVLYSYRCRDSDWKRKAKHLRALITEQHILIRDEKKKMYPVIAPKPGRPRKPLFSVPRKCHFCRKQLGDNPWPHQLPDWSRLVYACDKCHSQI